MLKKISIILIFLLFSVSAFSDKETICKERKYKIKVRYRSTKLYEGEVDCYFEYNKDLTKIKFGYIKKDSKYHIELEEIGEVKGKE